MHGIGLTWSCSSEAVVFGWMLHRSNPCQLALTKLRCDPTGESWAYSTLHKGFRHG